MYVAIGLTIFFVLTVCLLCYWLMNVGYVVHQWARGVKEHYQPLIKAPAYHCMWTISENGYDEERMPETVFEATLVLLREAFMLTIMAAFVAFTWPLTLFISTVILFAFSYRYMLMRRMNSRVKAKAQKVK